MRSLSDTIDHLLAVRSASASLEVDQTLDSHFPIFNKSMASNHLEDLIGEWLEYRGFFVRRNVLVGKRSRGGYECELDIVAFHPTDGRLLHYEPSMDAHSWAKRETRFSKKFAAGRKYIPALFEGIEIPATIEQFAVLGFASARNVKMLAGAKVQLASELVEEVLAGLSSKRLAKEAVPEQFPLIRTLQYVAEARWRSARSARY